MCLRLSRLAWKVSIFHFYHTRHIILIRNIAAHNGAYLANSQIANPRVDTVKPWGTSSVEAERFWEFTEELLKQKFGL